MTSGLKEAPPLGMDQFACTPKPLLPNSCCTENSNPWICVLLAFDGAVMSQITRGSPGCPGNVSCPGLSASICANIVCADTGLPAACSSAMALLATAPTFGSVIPNNGPLVVVWVRKFVTCFVNQLAET